MKKKKSAPTNPPPTGAARRTITRTFTNATEITIADAVDLHPSAATPFPSVIEVTGFTNGRIRDVNLTLHGFSHPYPGDVDILLAAAHLPGQNALVMSDTGDDIDHAVSNLTLTLDDQAADVLPENGLLVSGTFRPTDYAGFPAPPDVFPGQTPSGNAALSVFNSSDPNGTWQLFVVDDQDGDAGSIGGGWSLEITAEVDA
jgi:hypothetical protein